MRSINNSEMGSDNIFLYCEFSAIRTFSTPSVEAASFAAFAQSMPATSTCTGFAIFEAAVIAFLVASLRISLLCSANTKILIISLLKRFLIYPLNPQLSQPFHLLFLQVALLLFW